MEISMSIIYFGEVGYLAVAPLATGLEGEQTSPFDTRMTQQTVEWVPNSLDGWGR